MRLGLDLVTYLVGDYDEAIAWLTDKLGFVVEEDAPLGDGKRWVVVAPAHGEGARLLLACADGEMQAARVGDQTGGRVFLFLYTDDLRRDRRAMEARGVAFEEPIREERYGRVCVFKDLYGGRWDLIES